jgi:acetylornithine deacetylase
MSVVTQILLDLVAIPSVSAMRNEPVIEYIRRRLNPEHWGLESFPFADAAGTEKVNLVAFANSDATEDVELALVCHTDTVPFDPAWDGAIRPQVRDGRLYGRGSCDVKGFLACILAAVEQMDPRELEKPLALVFTADEEVGCVGAKHLIGENAIQARRFLIGEPTALHPVRAGKGYCLAEIVVRGREAHSALPSYGHSAIYDAARIVTSIEAIAKEVSGSCVPDFDPPYTTINVGVIQGGTAKNIIPGECRIVVEWRPVPGQDPRWIANLIERELAGYDASLEVQRLDPGFGPAGPETLAPFLASLTGRDTATVAFGTEAATLAGAGAEAVVFGPGDMSTAHRSGEYVPIDELELCVDYLLATIRHFCGVK